MSHSRWQVRIVYADRDERGVVAVLRADPVEWESGHPLRGGRVLAEILDEITNPELPVHPHLTPPEMRSSTPK